MELFLSGMVAGIVIIFALSLILFAMLGINAPLDPNESKIHNQKWE